MNNTDLAEFYGVTDRAVRKWSPERKHRKLVQALSGAEQPIVDMIADISKLVFIFNCKWLHGERQVKLICFEIDHCNIMFDGTESWQHIRLDSVHLVEQLESVKKELEELVYG